MALPDIPAGQTIDVEISRLDLAPNAREHSPEKLGSLAEDMRRNGQLQEIIVTPVGERFEVVSGTGRTLAARTMEWKTLRARVLPGISSLDKLRITFAENEEVEDVAPLYQASLIQAMLQEPEMTQVTLAARLGKTQAYVSQYARIAGLPERVRENINRFIFLGVAHLLQICRLQKEQDQIYFSSKSASQEWSVRELEAAIDAHLKPSQPPQQTSKEPKLPDLGLTDPLETVWETLYKKNLNPQGTWAAQYTLPHLWTFQVAAPSEDPQRQLGEFLIRLGQALSEATPPPKASFDIPEKNEQPSRLPQSPQDQKDFEAAARAGVPAFYAWLYGPNHPSVKGSKDLTWDFLGFNSPEEGANEMLAAIRENRPAMSPRRPGGA